MSITPAQLAAIEEIKQLLTTHFDSHIFAARASVEDGETDNYIFSRYGSSTDCMGLALAAYTRLEREADKLFDHQ